MKSSSIVLLAILFYSTQSFSQNDSLIFKNRRFISLSTNLSNRSYKFLNTNSSDNTGYISDLALNFSLGNFTKNGNANIFTLGLKNGNSEYDKLRANESSWKVSFAYAREKYKMLSNKIAIYGGLESNIFYENTFKKGQDSFNSVVLKNESNITEIGVSMKAYPGIIYFINSRWAVNATIGSLTLFSISNKKNNASGDYGDNGIIYTSYSTDSNFTYNFNPSFSISNSGVGIRYFFK